MKCRVSLQKTMAGLDVSAGWPRASLGTGRLAMAAPLSDAFAAPPDGYRVPERPRYARTVYFDAYSAPLYPHIGKFDAKRVVDIVVQLGADAFRFQPVGFVAYGPSQASPALPELASSSGEPQRENYLGGKGSGVPVLWFSTCRTVQAARGLPKRPRRPGREACGGRRRTPARFDEREWVDF
jgi:hypothetical protein